MGDNEVMRSISELPEDIIHCILSFLTTKEATKTSVLSKAWLKAWRTRPTLEFDYGELITHFKHTVSARKYIITNLLRYSKANVGIEAFTLAAPDRNDDIDYHFLDRCVRIVKKISARNLSLALRRCKVIESIFEVESLVEIKLEYCTMWFQTAAIMCRNLKRVYLLEVLLRKWALENIIQNCPLVEILEINRCKCDANFWVMTKNLRNLEQLKLLMSPCWLTLAEPWYQNLKSLSLCGVRIYGDVSIIFADKLKFPQLEDLSIQDCQDLQRIKISSTSLKKIQLANNIRLIEARFDVPSIVLFEYCDKKGRNETLPELSFTTTSGRWVSRIKLQFDGAIDTSWFSKLKEFLMGLNQSQVFITVQFQGDVVFNADEMTNADGFSDLQEIQEFYVYPDKQQFTSSRVLAILDGIFWTCRPLTITHWFCYHDDFMKLLYDMLVSRSNPGHSDSQGIRFWQSDLKAVKDIEILPGEISSHGTAVYKKGLDLGLPETLDWENFWAVLETHEDCLIGFNLDWGTPDTPSEPKRIKSTSYQSA